jgi:uncharacterized protein
MIMAEKRTTFALVTGASQGFGRCIAMELAKKGYNLILVALPNENIQQIASQAKALAVEAIYYETDLTNKENVLALTEWVNQNFDVSVLINNAGKGGTRSFLSCNADYIDSIIQLNITAPALITHQLLPNLKKQENAYILNVSSMASFSPIGYKTVYPASKRFVQHFSRGLYQELKGTNVFVSVVHPGPMKTNKDVSQRIERQGSLGRIGLLSPEKAAKICINQLFKKDSLILLGWANHLNWLLMSIIPIWIKLPLLTTAVRRELKPSVQ